jgi:uncharacterized protein YbcI
MDEQARFSQGRQQQVGVPPPEPNGIATEVTPSGGQRAAISNSLVRLMAQYYGRGPTKARTYINEDVVIVVLRDIFTTVEKTLIEVGKGEHVRETRFIFQQSMEVKFRHAVEEVTGRKVLAFLSQTHIGPDLAVEVFLLEPHNGD